MDKLFFSLPIEKQNNIIDAALTCFGSSGYKKASVSDIAAVASISKASIFQYFGTKKELYCYLLELCSNIVLNEFSQKMDYEVTDFFEKIKHTTNIKILVMKKHPKVLTFISSVYHERHNEVKDEIKNFFARGENFREENVINKIDASKFKDEINTDLVLNTLACYAEEYISSVSRRKDFDIETVCKEFNESIDLFKIAFYKNEYL